MRTLEEYLRDSCCFCWPLKQIIFYLVQKAPPKVLNSAPSSKHSVCIDRSILHSEERLWPELREELDIVYGRYDTARSSSNFGHHCLYIKKNDTVMKEDNSLKYVYADDAILFKSHLLTSSCLAKAKNLLPCPTELSCL